MSVGVMSAMGCHICPTGQSAVCALAQGVFDHGLEALLQLGALKRVGRVR